MVIFSEIKPVVSVNVRFRILYYIQRGRSLVVCGFELVLGSGNVNKALILTNFHEGDEQIWGGSLTVPAEHPITEWTAESQKLIYTQHKLRLEWAFLFGKFPRATSVNATPFDFDKTKSIRPKGHCVVVRVTIEDPDDCFKPTGGKVQLSPKSLTELIVTQFHSLNLPQLILEGKPDLDGLPRPHQLIIDKLELVEKLLEQFL
ncbi:4-alpha-glucanotransferase DPE2 [Tanacetum coccineum]